MEQTHPLKSKLSTQHFGWVGITVLFCSWALKCCFCLNVASCSVSYSLDCPLLLQFAYTGETKKMKYPTW